MEPGEFNERLEDLVDEGLDSGLHVNHIVNALEDKRSYALEG